MFSQKPEQIRSVASDGLIKYLEATVSLNIKNPVQISRKTGFKVEIEDQNQRQSWLQLVGSFGITISKWGNFLLLYSIWPWRSRPITRQYNRDLSHSFYTSGPNLVILAWMGEQAWGSHTHTQNTHRRWPYPKAKNWSVGNDRIMVRTNW